MLLLPRPLSTGIAALTAALSFLPACGDKTEGSGAPPTSTAPAAPAKSGGAASGPYAQSGSKGPAPASAEESFFSGPVPASVKMKPLKGFAIGPGVLLLTGVEGWSGGQLPGYEYMGMSKDQSAVVRVVTSVGVVGEMNCKEIASAAGMAPLRAKNLADVGTATMRKVGKNQFVAREGVCSADGQKGPLDIYFINIARKDNEGVWHYAVMAAVPKDAPPALRDEAKAWARSLEYTGQNAYKLP
jgi:hypothetical protein